MLWKTQYEAYSEITLRELYKMQIDFWTIEKFRLEAFKFSWPVLISSGNPRHEAENPEAEQITLYFSKLSGEKPRILDIGAGEMYLKKALETRHIDADYRSMDISKSSGKKYDFDSIESIVGQYDLIIMQEVLEHLPLETGLDYLRKAYELLSPQGYLVVTVPNVSRPVQFFIDFSHITHYPLPDLYAILRATGFKGEAIFRRIEIRPSGLSIKNRCILQIRKFLYKLMGFDWAHGVLCMVAKC